ncbi:MAG: CoA-binding protein [Deltaproteobacteria bacterium]|nr:CoA-binding protein [Deltaproteobacteria bacterium]
MAIKPLPDAFFEPRSIAVIGASVNKLFGSAIPKTLIELGYKEHLYLVNPHQREIEGMPVYRRVTDVQQAVDLAIVVVPGMNVPDVIRDCRAKNIPAVIIESAGFSEIGEEGAKLEEEIKALIRGTDMRIIGPNCIGVVNTHGRFASTELAFDELREGNIGVIAQSGVFGNILTDWAPTQNLAFSKLVTIGNCIDVDETDLIYYFAEDEKTDVIVLYLEGVSNGPRFFKAASEVSPKKPILVYKSGRTKEGGQAAAIHTGSISGEDNLYEGLFRQAGVIRTYSFQELFDLARVFAAEPLMTGPNVGIVTCSGSLGVMAADECARLGLNFPALCPEAVTELNKQKPAWMKIGNPLDVGPSGLFSNAINAVLKDDRINGMIAFPVVPGTAVETLEKEGINLELLFGDAVEYRILSQHKPLVMFTFGADFWMREVKKLLGGAFTIVSSPEIASRALWQLYRYYQYRQMKSGAAI